MRISLNRTGAFVALALMMTLPPAFAQTPRPLSLAEAIKLAQERSPLPKAANARIEGAKARIQGAKAVPNPILMFGQPFGGDTGGLDEAYWLTQTIELPEKPKQRARAARADFEATKAEAAGAGTDLVFAVQSAYYDALRAEAERKLAVESLDRARSFAQAADNQFRAGDAARSAVVRSQIEFNIANQELVAAITESENSLAALKSLLGLPASEQLTLAESLRDAPNAPLGYALSALLAQARRNRADLRAARMVRESKDADIRTARAQSQPDLFMEYRHSAVDPTVGGNSLRIGFTVPLFDLGKIHSDVNGAKAALKEQDANIQEAERAAVLEVETAFRNWAQAKSAADSFVTERLSRSKELLDMAQIGYEKGANSYLELLDAQHLYRSEQTEYIRALTNYNIARASLQKAVGGTLP